MYWKYSKGDLHVLIVHPTSNSKMPQELVDESAWPQSIAVALTLVDLAVAFALAPLPKSGFPVLIRYSEALRLHDFR